jgi:hypothetical protein
MYRAPVEWDNRPMDSFTEPPNFDEEHVNFTLRYYFNRNDLLTSKVIWGVADESAWKKEPCHHVEIQYFAPLSSAIALL